MKAVIDGLSGPSLSERLNAAFPEPLDIGATGKSVQDVAPPPTHLTPEQWNVLNALNWTGSIGKVGAGLDMSKAARMARAADLGFDTERPLYHGTAGDFKAFDTDFAGTAAGSPEERAVFLSPSPEIANMFSEIAGTHLPMDPENPMVPGAGDMHGSNVIKAYTSASNPLVVNAPMYNGKRFADAIKAAQAAGKDSVLFKGVHEGSVGPMDQYAILDPAKIRSVHAAFDPAQRNSRDLLAATLPISIIMNALMGTSRDQNK
jgi:hypothetical protein